MRWDGKILCCDEADDDIKRAVVSHSLRPNQAISH